MINLVKKVIFIHIPKTGGSSVRTALTGDEYIGNHVLGISHARYLKNKGNYINGWHIPERTFHGKWHKMKNFLDCFNYEMEDFFKFTIVRNPFDMAVSRYNYDKHISKSNGDLSFEEAIKTSKFRGRLNTDKMINYIPDFSKMDFIIRYENINKGWECVAEIIGYNPILPHYNKAKEHTTDLRPSYRDYYESQEAIDIISNLYKDELELFGYKF